MSELIKQFEEYWNLYPQGSKEDTWNTFNVVIAQNYTSFDGIAINFEYIKEKYIAYLNWWNYSFGKKDKKFIAKIDEKKSPYGFLVTEGWNNNYIIDIDSKRDKYLFGNISISELTDKVIDFRKRIYGEEPKQKKSRKIQLSEEDPF